MGGVLSSDALRAQFPNLQDRVAKLQVWVSQAQAQLTVLIIWHLAMTILLVVGSIVPDFAVVSPPGTLAVPHTIWALSGIFLFLMATMSIYLGVRFDTTKQGRALRAFIAFIVVDLVANIVHAVFTIIELVDCNTDLCNNVNSTVGYAVLIILLILLAVWALVLDPILIWRTVVFMRRIESAEGAGWVAGKSAMQGQAATNVSSRMHHRYYRPSSQKARQFSK